MARRHRVPGASLAALADGAVTALTTGVLHRAPVWRRPPTRCFRCPWPLAATTDENGGGVGDPMQRLPAGLTLAGLVALNSGGQRARPGFIHNLHTPLPAAARG